MFKVPAKFHRSITQELKKYIPLMKSLQERGKNSSEEDARVLLNDILHDVLGYDKYSELRTEHRSKSSWLDYTIKFNDGPYKNKPDLFDLVIEAKACHVELKDAHIDQTLNYCIQTGTTFFILTNLLTWKLFQVKKQGKATQAFEVYTIDFSSTNDPESVADDFYLFSKASYLDENWKEVGEKVRALSVDDMVAMLLSDKMVRTLTRELSAFSDVKLDEDSVRESLENQVIKSSVASINHKLIKKINDRCAKKTSKGSESSDSVQAEMPLEKQEVESPVVDASEPTGEKVA